MNNLENEQLTLYEGSDKTFSLNGKDFTVPARLDTYNYYRNTFRELATYYSDKASQKYIECVSDANSFFEHVLEIYNENLNAVIDCAIDVLVSDNIFQYSVETFASTHQKTSCEVMEYCSQIYEEYETLKQSSAQTVQGISNLASSLLGQKSWVLGEFVSGMGEGLAESVSLSDEQLHAFFVSIEPQRVFNGAYRDYWKVYLTLVYCLKEHNKDIWTPDEATTDEIDTTLQLLAKPNFPQDKVTDLILNLISKDPYRKEIYDLMKEKFGDNEEVLNIIGYFGFSDYTENIFTADNFPKVEKVTETTTESVEQGNANEQASSETQGATSQAQDTTANTSGKKGLLSFVDKLDSEKVKKGLKIGAGIAVAGALLNGLGSGSSSSTSSSSGKKDLLGSASCVLGKTDPKRKWYTRTCADCPYQVRSQCSRY